MRKLLAYKGKVNWLCT